MYYTDDWYIAMNDDAIAWEMRGDSAETITIDGAGLITVSENAQHEELGYPFFSIKDYDQELVETDWGKITVTTQQ